MDAAWLDIGRARVQSLFQPFPRHQAQPPTPSRYQTTRSTENFITEHDYEYFNNLLKEQIEHFIGTGQYGQVLKILSLVKAKAGSNTSQPMNIDILTPENAVSLVDSFKIVNGQNREDALLLCEHYGQRIVPPLMDALTHEDSRRIRKFLLDLVIHIR